MNGEFTLSEIENTFSYLSLSGADLLSRFMTVVTRCFLYNAVIPITRRYSKPEGLYALLSQPLTFPRLRNTCSLFLCVWDEEALMPTVDLAVACMLVQRRIRSIFSESNWYTNCYH